MVSGKNIVVAKLVGAGIALIFMGIGILSYADTANNIWTEFWKEVLHRSAPFQIVDPYLGIWAILIGFTLIGIGYLFHRF